MAKAKVTQERILEAAAELLSQNGYGQLTIKDVAKKLGIQPPSLYNHIQSLEELYERLTVQSLQQLKDNMLEAAAGLSGDKAIFAMGQAYLDYARQSPGRAELMQASNSWNSASTQPIADKIVRVVGNCLQQYDLSDSERTHVVRMFRALLSGYASILIRQGFGSPVPVEQSFEEALRLMLAGIRHCYPVQQEA